MKQQAALYFLFLLMGSLRVAAQKADTLSGKDNEVVVTGQYGAQSIRNSVYKVKVIDAQRIKARGATNAIGVLNSELGIRFSTDNTLGETDTKILGLGTSRIKILLDGIPLVDRDATKQSLTQIDINTIERIEIVEGPMSVVYGTDALAGVINIITKKHVGPGNYLSIGARVQEETVADTYQPFSKKGIHNENLNINWNNNNWKIGGYVTRNNFGGFTDSAIYPAQIFKPKNQWLGGGTIGYRTGKINAWYRLDYANENLLDARALNAFNVSFQQHYITNRYNHQAQADWQLNTKFKMNAALSLQDYKRQTESYDKNYATGVKTVNNNNKGYWDLSAFKSFFGRATAVWTISPTVSVQPGFEIKEDKGSGQRLKGTPSITDIAFFASAEIKPTAAISIRPGVRFSKNSVYDAPPIIPSLNTKFTLSKILDVRLSYARGFRAPILRELYFDFIDANHKIVGNPNLKAEESNSFTASLSANKWMDKKVQVTSAVTGFYNAYKNFIDYYQVTNDTTSYLNIDRYKTIGATFENTILYKNLTVNLGFSYIGYYNKYQENTQLAGDRSQYAWSPEVNTNLSYRFPKAKAQVGLYYKFTGKIPTYVTDAQDNIILSQRQAFHWADFTASKEICSLFTLQGGIKNLFNVTALNSTAGGGNSPHSEGTVSRYAYGRSYFLGVIFQWNKHN